LNLVDLVEREIGVPLSTAMSKVLQTGEPIHYSPIALSDSRNIGLLVESFQPEPNDTQYLLVYLEEGQHTHNVETTVFDLRKSMQRISDLEQELRLNKVRLKELIEELEASNEELQTSNEELQASNEELQSTNEELESVNEELQTVNNECENKIAELTKTNDDIDNFISSAAIATIFLDSSLRIRRFTPTAAIKTGLLPHDVGREITALSHPLLILAAKSAREIIAGSELLETILPHESGSLMLMRATPFIRKDGQHSGATVSFICIGPIPNAPGSLV
jgi:two-component system CheB/CheR fusion protein